MKTNETKWRQSRERRTTCLVREAGPKSKRGCSISLSGPLSDCSANQCGSPPSPLFHRLSHSKYGQNTKVLSLILPRKGKGRPCVASTGFGFLVSVLRFAGDDAAKRSWGGEGRGEGLPFFLATPVCSELKCIQLDGGLRAELSCFCSA